MRLAHPVNLAPGEGKEASKSRPQRSSKHLAGGLKKREAGKKGLEKKRGGKRQRCVGSGLGRGVSGGAKAGVVGVATRGVGYESGVARRGSCYQVGHAEPQLHSHTSTQQLRSAPPTLNAPTSAAG